MPDRRGLQIALLSGLLTAGVGAPVHAAEDAVSTVADELSGDAFEVSEAGAEEGGLASRATVRKGNWVAVPVPVSNPTIGSGLALATMYLHPRPEGDDSPNSTTGVGVLYTDSDSWAGGVFFDYYLAGDAHRVRGAAGAADLNLRFFGVGSDAATSGLTIPYNIEASFVAPRYIARLPGTQGWYAGLDLVLADGSVTFDPADLVGLPLPPITGEFALAGLGPVLQYDDRDNNYFPRTGRFAEFQLIDYRDDLGSDFEFWSFGAEFNSYATTHERLTIAFRTELQAAEEGAPFFMLPYVDVRGVPSAYYRDQATLSVHLEGRFRFSDRWGMNTFIEAGTFGPELSAVTTHGTGPSYGLGIRWQVTAAQELNLGVDIAFHDDEEALYVMIGESF